MSQRLPALTATTLTALIALLTLQGCQDKPAPNSPAQQSFDAIAQACTRSLAARTPQVQPGPSGDWTQTGFSPADVRAEISPTESAATPYVGKIVIKDNLAQAHAPTEAAARAITLTPAHLLANRTHTFIYRFDGQQWQWHNGQVLTKAPPLDDTAAPLTLAEVSANFAGCLPR